MEEPRSGRELFRLVGGTRRWIALSALLGILTIGAGIGLVAMAVSLLTRSALFGASVSLSLTILGVRFFAVTRVVGRYCERYLGHLGTFRVLTRIRVWFYAALLQTDSIDRSGHRRGDLVTRLVDDVETMQDRLLRVSAPILVAAGTLVISVTALLMINAVAALIVTCAFIFEVVALPPLLHARTRHAAAELVALQARRNADAVEFLEGLETLSVWGSSNDFEASFRSLDQREALLRRSLTSKKTLLDAVTIFITGGSVLAILAVLQQSSTPSSRLWWVAAVPLIALATFEALGPTLSVPENKERTDSAAGRILSTVGEPSMHSRSPSETTMQRSDRPTGSNPTIIMDSVTFTYDGTRKILDDASLVVPFGTTVAISAPTGSGKSTLVDLLLGFLQPRTGSLIVGEDSPASTNHRSSPLVAAVLQADHVFDTTIRDNLLVGDGDASDEELLHACEIAGLLPFLESRSGGLDAAIGADGALLSGGERQRLMIARAIVADAPILILDEATEHLEPERRSAITEAILDARLGRTTIILAHDVDVRLRADAIYELREGTLVPLPS